MAAVDEKRDQFERYKQDVEHEGKPFFPYAMFHDTVMSFIVVSVIIALACIWYYSADGTEPGLLGPHYAEKADPGTTSFIPRPDWYFYFLFYLLRIFKWPDSVILATVGIPTILLVVLILLPFLDRRTERRFSRRPVAIVTFFLTVLAMGTLTYKGATARESLGSEAVLQVEAWSEEQGGFSEEAMQGAEIFAQVGCLNCHTYLGSGTQSLGAPDLSDIGASGRDAEYFASYVANPADYGNNQMPSFARLGEENLNLVAQFLVESKGEG